MILRKPYAFLIKHYKLIHAVLVLLFVYVSTKTNAIVGFLNKYINNEKTYTPNDNLASVYTGFLVYAALILALGIIIAILVLMYVKKKRKAIYIALACYTIALVILFIVLSSFFGSIQYSVTDIRYGKALKDVVTGVYISEYAFLIILFVKAIGFNIKTFDFSKDTDALDVAEHDDEEFELDIKLDAEDIIAKSRKQLRIIKYIYVENKFIILTIISIIVGITIITGVNKILDREKIYRENNIFESNNYEMKITSSFKTRYDYRNNLISKDNFYLVVNIEARNKSNWDMTFNINSTRIKAATYEVISPITTKYNEFVDFGKPYYGTIIKPNNKINTILVYEIDNEYYDNDFQFQYSIGTSRENNQTKFNYLKVDLNPKEFKELENTTPVVTVTDNKELTFTDSIFEGATIKIDSVEFSGKFEYKYTNCIKGNCTTYTKFLTPTYKKETNPTLMKINYVLKSNNNIHITSVSGKFIERFGYIQYSYKGKSYEAKAVLSDITPYSLENYAYIEVPDRVNIADEVFLVFKIRDKIFSYSIYKKQVEL